MKEKLIKEQPKNIIRDPAEVLLELEAKSARAQMQEKAKAQWGGGYDPDYISKEIGKNIPGGRNGGTLALYSGVRRLLKPFLWLLFAAIASSFVTLLFMIIVGPFQFLVFKSAFFYASIFIVPVTLLFPTYKKMLSETQDENESWWYAWLYFFVWSKDR